MLQASPTSQSPKPRTEHIQDIHYDKFDNNAQERLNGEFRDLGQVTRDLKKEDPATIQDFGICHNRIKPHMELGGNMLTDKAGIIIEGSSK